MVLLFYIVLTEKLSKTKNINQVSPRRDALYEEWGLGGCTNVPPTEYNPPNLYTTIWDFIDDPSVSSRT